RCCRRGSRSRGRSRPCRRRSAAESCCPLLPRCEDARAGLLSRCSVRHSIFHNYGAENSAEFRRNDVRKYAAWLALALVSLVHAPAFAETAELRISKGFGVPYLPMMIIQDRQLVEKHAKAAGLNLKVTWATIDGGNVINDAMLSGALDIATIGPP